LSTASAWGCKCSVCHEAVYEQSKLESRRIYFAKTFRRWQKESQEAAHRSWFVWTGPELELADRRELSARYVAKVTGRTVAAVQNMRRRIASGDPRLDHAIGKVKTHERH
jgi:hypothetical protein